MASLEIDELGGTRRIRVYGEIDMTNAGSLGSRLADECTVTGRAVLDLSDVSYINSQALNMLQRLGDQLAAAPTELIVVARPDSVAARLFDITAMNAHLDVRPSFDV
jgi:anti-anti-sigma factor